MRYPGALMEPSRRTTRRMVTVPPDRLWQIKPWAGGLTVAIGPPLFSLLVAHVPSNGVKVRIANWARFGRANLARPCLHIVAGSREPGTGGVSALIIETRASGF